MGVLALQTAPREGRQSGELKLTPVPQNLQQPPVNTPPSEQQTNTAAVSPTVIKDVVREGQHRLKAIEARLSSSDQGTFRDQIAAVRELITFVSQYSEALPTGKPEELAQSYSTYDKAARGGHPLTGLTLPNETLKFLTAVRIAGAALFAVISLEQIQSAKNSEASGDFVTRLFAGKHPSELKAETLGAQFKTQLTICLDHAREMQQLFQDLQGLSSSQTRAPEEQQRRYIHAATKADKKLAELFSPQALNRLKERLQSYTAHWLANIEAAPEAGEWLSTPLLFMGAPGIVGGGLRALALRAAVSGAATSVAAGIQHTKPLYQQQLGQLTPDQAQPLHQANLKQALFAGGMAGGGAFVGGGLPLVLMRLGGTSISPLLLRSVGVFGAATAAGSFQYGAGQTAEERTAETQIAAITGALTAVTPRPWVAAALTTLGAASMRAGEQGTSVASELPRAALVTLPAALWGTSVRGSTAALSAAVTDRLAELGENLRQIPRQVDIRVQRRFNMKGTNQIRNPGEKASIYSDPEKHLYPDPEARLLQHQNPHQKVIFSRPLEDRGALTEHLSVTITPDTQGGLEGIRITMKEGQKPLKLTLSDNTQVDSLFLRRGEPVPVDWFDPSGPRVRASSAGFVFNKEGKLIGSVKGQAPNGWNQEGIADIFKQNRRAHSIDTYNSDGERTTHVRP